MRETELGFKAAGRQVAQFVQLAGWRGSASQIAVRAVERMAADFGSRPEQLEALIGPCIGSDRYEVGSEVAEHFQRIVKKVGSIPNVTRQLINKLTLSNRKHYKAGVAILGTEVTSIKSNLRNKKRTYIAGQDSIEEWDRQMMEKHDISPQWIS